MCAILYLKEILGGGTISRWQRTGYKLRFSADISLVMLMAVIHGLFVVSAGSTKPTPEARSLLFFVISSAISCTNRRHYPSVR